MPTTGSNKSAIRARHTLTAKQHAFCTYVAGGDSQSGAYRRAYNPHLLDQDAAERSCRLAANPQVKARIEQLRGQVVRKALLARNERMGILAEIAQDGAAPRSDRIRAIGEYNKMAPDGPIPTQRMELTGPGGAPLTMALSGAINVAGMSVRDRAAALRQARKDREAREQEPA